jgi:hypothetical protein
VRAGKGRGEVRSYGFTLEHGHENAGCNVEHAGEKPIDIVGVDPVNLRNASSNRRINLPQLL